MPNWSRRSVLGLLGAGGTGLLRHPAAAQTGDGVLARARKAGIIKVGIVNAASYGALKPDGTVDGLAPTIVRLVMERLGIPKIEAFVASYGELIPGLNAGRWDMIGAALGVTKSRCDQVAYTDPFGDDYSAWIYLPSELPNPPQSIKEMAGRNLKVGVSAGAYGVSLLQAAYSDRSSISIFPDSTTTIEAVLTKRVQIGSAGIVLARQRLAAKPGSFAHVGPLPDDVIVPLSGAFRPRDTDILDAFQAEFRKMKLSGEWEKIVVGFGFDVLAGAKEMTADKACREAV